MRILVTSQCIPCSQVDHVGPVYEVCRRTVEWILYGLGLAVVSDYGFVYLDQDQTTTNTDLKLLRIESLDTHSQSPGSA